MSHSSTLFSQPDGCGNHAPDRSQGFYRVRGYEELIFTVRVSNLHLQFSDENFYIKHSTICFDTLYTKQEYQIVAVFESQIYRKSDTVFKHYNFLSAESEADFDEYITNIKAIALYDTGVTASYGDELLTLVTCAYHTENGQFVVVARKLSIEQRSKV